MRDGNLSVLKNILFHCIQTRSSHEIPPNTKGNYQFLYHQIAIMSTGRMYGNEDQRIETWRKRYARRFSCLDFRAAAKTSFSCACRFRNLSDAPQSRLMTASSGRHRIFSRFICCKYITRPLLFYKSSATCLLYHRLQRLSSFLFYWANKPILRA